ncbi:MAG: phosphodiester glycosidase family protein [Muribaculaceae bacterium]|nr:phosphodiester glycosidase family protein [Muribaculaceae bacterium]
MNKLIITLAAGFAILSSCSDNVDAGSVPTLLPPSDIAVERTGEDQVLVSWKDNSSSETGYAVVVRKADTQVGQEVAQVAANETSCTLTGVLQEGNKYFVGVKAFSAKEQTRVISVLYNMQVLADLPKVNFSDLNSADNCVWGTYKISNVDLGSIAEWGLCWSSAGVPTVADSHLAGPAVDADGNVFQVIPNTELEYGVDYQVRAYIKVADEVYYSAATTASVTKESQAITLQWNKLADTGLPSSIEVYETTSQLNGSAFHAWYAIADLSKGDVELRVNVPASAKTIDEQAASFNGDCYVMINGGYFYNGKNTGLAVVEGKADGSINDVRGSLLSADEEYNVMYSITRGCFGVDSNGKPAAYWAGTDDSGKSMYYDTPLATVKGENKYGKPSAKLPESPVSWNPKYALSAGPLLLIDGKIPFDFTTTAKGADFYLTNYELMPYDIFGTNVTPDRTAAGYTEDGKVILFICDGRIPESDGATLVELAQIMKGLGCVGAVNFDGGGSTGMMVGDKHINDVTPNNRPVVSTLGFFKK